ncbi:hypothetical protein [Streptomyces globosus]|uniref:hypothetical protein n=1 Tax=Streptomyces globosus TaxID=68209 RepID=UPI0031CEEDC1
MSPHVPDEPAPVDRDGRPARPLLTFRVSTDGGRTYSDTRTVWSSDPLTVAHSLAWPPCECPLHRTD